MTPQKKKNESVNAIILALKFSFCSLGMGKVRHLENLAEKVCLTLKVLPLVVIIKNSLYFFLYIHNKVLFCFPSSLS